MLDCNGSSVLCATDVSPTLIKIFYYLFLPSINVQVNKNPHHLPLAADLRFISYCCAPSRQQYNFLEKPLSICCTVVIGTAV